MMRYLTSLLAASLLAGACEVRTLDDGVYSYQRSENTRSCTVQTVSVHKKISCTYKGVETVSVDGELVEYKENDRPVRVSARDGYKKTEEMREKHRQTLHIVSTRAKKIS